jgi:hypothetical protein
MGGYTVQSNTACYSFSNSFYYTLSDMFRPIYKGHLQASVLGGVVNTIQLQYVLYEILYHVNTENVHIS